VPECTLAVLADGEGESLLVVFASVHALQQPSPTLRRLPLTVFVMESKQGAGGAPPVPEPRLIPHVVSERAKNAPQSIWASIPISPTDASAGFEDVTFARFNYAVTRAAHWLQETLGPQDSLPPKALAYIGPPDTRYIVFIIAAIKTGFKVCFIGGSQVYSYRVNDEIML
jgi:hypothetical protein